MSHEIRTPITAVMGISEIQLRRQTMSPVTEEAFIRIYDSSKMLLNIVNDVLDLSRIESGKMELSCGQYDFAYLISYAAQLHLLYLEHKQVSFKIEIDENIPVKLYGDSFFMSKPIDIKILNSYLVRFIKNKQKENQLYEQ